MVQEQPHTVIRADGEDDRFRLLSTALNCNNVGATTSEELSQGAFNVWGNSVSAESLPDTRVTLKGIPFELPEWGCGRPDNIRCEGQYIDVPERRYDWLYMLAAGERRVEDEVALHFVEDAVDFETVRVSDFWAARAAFGEQAALESPVMHYPHHVQQRVTARIWLERVPIVRQTRLVGFRLPQNVAIHIFAMTLATADSRDN